MFWVEMFATWVLVAIVLTVKYHYKGVESVVCPLTVGLALFVGISWSAGTSGACLNPAVGIANSIFQYSMNFS
jgi:glycerol uptake facilitator-like aquaporin